MARVFNWQIGREMSYWYPESRPRRQFAAVFDINKCIACRTCTLACKTTWTSGKGQECMLWNNVETKPYGSYPLAYDVKLLEMLGGQEWDGNRYAGRTLFEAAPAGERVLGVRPGQEDYSYPNTGEDDCAGQVPSRIEPDLPEPQMGQEGRTVQIVYWRADWQAWVDGRGDTIRDLYPNAGIDHYPFEAKSLEPGSAARQEMERIYSPAAASGNRRAGPRTSPVESLIATGPGTLSPAPNQDATGRGVFQKGRWLVLIRRPLPQGLGRDQRTHAAFAVWQGSHQEAGARKMRTGWVPLVRRAGS